MSQTLGNEPAHAPEVPPATYEARASLLVKILSSLSISCGLLLLTISIGVAATETLQADDFVALPILGAIALALVIVPPVPWMRARGRTTALAEGGLKDCHRGSVRTVRWADIEEIVYFSVFRPTTGWITGLRARGRSFGEIRWHNQWMAGVDAMARAIEARVYPRIMAASIDAWGRGVPIAFGPLRVTRDGLMRGGKTLPWRDLASMRVTTGKIWILAAGRLRPWAVYGRREVPNAEVLREVVGRLAGRPVE
jgi:hypothetical protein